jgi:hypothetical protein
MSMACVETGRIADHSEIARRNAGRSAFEAVMYITDKTLCMSP